MEQGSHLGVSENQADIHKYTKYLKKTKYIQLMKHIMYIHRRNLLENETSLETSSGKVDQILGNETNSELWKASVLLLKRRKPKLAAFLELDVFTVM